MNFSEWASLFLSFPLLSSLLQCRPVALFVFKLSIDREKDKLPKQWMPWWPHDPPMQPILQEIDCKQVSNCQMPLKHHKKTTEGALKTGSPCFNHYEPLCTNVSQCEPMWATTRDLTTARTSTVLSAWNVSLECHQLFKPTSTNSGCWEKDLTVWNSKKKKKQERCLISSLSHKSDA